MIARRWNTQPRRVMSDICGHIGHDDPTTVIPFNLESCLIVRVIVPNNEGAAPGYDQPAGRCGNSFFGWQNVGYNSVQTHIRGFGLINGEKVMKLRVMVKVQRKRARRSSI